MSKTATRSAGAAKARAVSAARVGASARAAPRPTLRNRNVAGTRGGVATQALGPNEIALLAEVPESQVNEIFHTAGVMFAITLTGLALGFVLLRVESLVEAGNKE